MTLDDLKRLFTRQTLFRLDAVLSPRLVPILYALGLAAILLWAIAHFFFRFSTGFGDGLWGILEIVVFGLFAFVALRIACEALLVWFKAHETTGESVNRTRYSTSLLDEVRDAIRDLAEEGEDPADLDDDEIIPATEPLPDEPPRPRSRPAAAPKPAARREPATKAGEPFKPRRTARRTPPKKTHE